MTEADLVRKLEDVADTLRELGREQVLLTLLGPSGPPLCMAVAVGDRAGELDHLLEGTFSRWGAACSHRCALCLQVTPCHCRAVRFRAPELEAWAEDVAPQLLEPAGTFEAVK